MGVFSTFLVPILAVIKSPDRPLPEDKRRLFRVMRKSLAKRYRADLDDIRMLFRLGGLRGDPFS